MHVKVNYSAIMWCAIAHVTVCDKSVTVVEHYVEWYIVFKGFLSCVEGLSGFIPSKIELCCYIHLMTSLTEKANVSQLFFKVIFTPFKRIIIWYPSHVFANIVYIMMIILDYALFQLWLLKYLLIHLHERIDNILVIYSWSALHKCV